MLPGLEAQLVGLSAGEERTVEVSFPAEYRVAARAGIAAHAAPSATEQWPLFAQYCSDCHNPAQFCQACHQRSGLVAIRT